MYRKGSDELAAARDELVSYGHACLTTDWPSAARATSACVWGTSWRSPRPAIHYAITALGGPVRVAPYVRFGSAALAAAAVEALDGRSVVILRNHGAVTYGRHLAQAYERALLLEWLARTHRLTLSYGEPATLSPSELEEVAAETRRRRYGERWTPPS